MELVRPRTQVLAFRRDGIGCLRVTGLPHQPKPAVDLAVDSGRFILNDVPSITALFQATTVLEGNLGEAEGFDPFAFVPQE